MVAGQSQGPHWLGGCLILFAIFSVLSLAMAIVDAVMTMLQFVGIALASLLALYLGILLLTLLFGPLLDWIRREIEHLQMRRRRYETIRRSPFPRHELLQNENHLDAVMWRLIDSSLGRETVRIRSGFGFKRRRSRQISELRDLRQQLLEDQECFEEWRQEGLLWVLGDPHNQATLTGIYNKILRRVQDEVRRRQPASRLSEVVRLAIHHDRENALPRWHLTRQALSFLTRYKSDGGQTALQRVSEVDQGAKILSYVTNGERFRQFMEQQFFMLMGELGSFEFYLPKVHAYYRCEREEQKHYAAPEPAASRHLLPMKAQTTEEAEELERYKQRAQELTRQAKERANRIGKLRKKYRISKRPGAIFSLFSVGMSEVAHDIRTLLLEQNDNDPDAAEAALERLQEHRPEFDVFWKAHEADVLEAYDDRMAAQQVAASREEDEHWQQQTLERALSAHRAEQERVRKEEYVAVDLEYGSLLAAVRQHIRSTLSDPEADTLDLYLERELRSHLTEPGARGRFFGDAVRQALHDCEQFRQGTLSYAVALQELGYEPTADRDQLVLEFVEHAGRWRPNLQVGETPANPVGGSPADKAPVPAVSTAADEPQQETVAPPSPPSTPPADPKEPFLLNVDESDAEHVLLTTKQAAEYLKLTSRALEGYRYKGGGPQIVKLSPRAVRYRFSDLLAWVKDRLRT